MKINNEGNDNYIIMNEDNEEEEEKKTIVILNMKKKIINYILQFLLDNYILKKNPIWEKCNKLMKLVTNKHRVDREMWRCTIKRSNKYDIKLNIRKGSMFEKFKTGIRILYYLLFYHFVENKGVKKSYRNVK